MMQPAFGDSHAAAADAVSMPQQQQQQPQHDSSYDPNAAHGSAVMKFSEQEVVAAVLQMNSAITSLLHDTSQSNRSAANAWLTSFCSQPIAWTAALYLAFPPHSAAAEAAGGGRGDGGGAGGGAGPPAFAADVRFFALNVLLSKIRADWNQLLPDDAMEIYEALIRQLPLNFDWTIRSRLCIVIGAAAALAGADICYELVESMKKEPDFPLAVELLTALAEEALLRSRALPWEVLGCLQKCCPRVIRLLERHLTATADASGAQPHPQQQQEPAAASVAAAVGRFPPELLVRAVTCLSRWKHAGLTLSELHREHTALHIALMSLLTSSNMRLVEASVALLTDLVAEVDILPGRDEAVKDTIAALLPLKSSPADFPGGPLVPLLATIGTAEPALLVSGGPNNLLLLQWLVQLTRGGAPPPAAAAAAAAGGNSMGGTAGKQGAGVGLRSVDSAAMVAEVWVKLSRVPIGRRSGEVRWTDLFAAVLEALLAAVELPEEDDVDIDEDDMDSFREGPASEALAACFVELGPLFLDFVSARLSAASSWQAAEAVYLAVGAASRELLAVGGMVGSEEEARGGGRAKGRGGVVSEEQLQQEGIIVRSFVSQLFSSLPAAAAVAAKDSAHLPNPALIGCALLTVTKLAAFCPHDPTALERGVTYAVGALHVPQARPAAATALQALCDVAAPHLAAARILAPLMDSCLPPASSSLPSSSAGSEGLDVDERVELVRGFSAVACMLPPAEAQSALAHLAGPAIANIQSLAQSKDKSAASRSTLAADLAVISALLSTVSLKLTPNPLTLAAPPSHVTPDALLLPLLSSFWSSLEQIALLWADDATVGPALCCLWGTTAHAVGTQLAVVLPQVIAAATAMFRQHLHAACLNCLAQITAMDRVGARGSSEVEAALSAILPQVVDTLPLLNNLLPRGRDATGTASSPAAAAAGGTPPKAAAAALGSPATSSPTMWRGRGGGGGGGKEQRRDHEKAVESYRAVWELSREYLRHMPQALLPTPLFAVLCRQALDLISREESEVAESAAIFLAQSINGGPLKDDSSRLLSSPVVSPSVPSPLFLTEDWQLPEGLMPHVDAVCGELGAQLVQSLLSSIANACMGREVEAALIDTLFALSKRHPAACAAAMYSFLTSKASPVKRGDLSGRHLDMFVAAATRTPPHSKRRYQDLMIDFAKVANGLMPSETFESY